MATVVTNELLYAVPIWADGLIYAHNVDKLLRPQRKVTLRCLMAYRTVTTAAVIVVIKIIFAHLAAHESQMRYRNRRQEPPSKKRKSGQLQSTNSTKSCRKPILRREAVPPDL